MNWVEKFSVVGFLLFVLAAVAAIYGYASNIVKMIGLLGGEISAIFVARCVGIFFAPLGSILGFF